MCRVSEAIRVHLDPESSRIRRCSCHATASADVGQSDAAGFFFDFAQVLEQPWPVSVGSDPRFLPLGIVEERVESGAQDRAQFEAPRSSAPNFGVHCFFGFGRGSVIDVVPSEDVPFDVVARFEVELCEDCFVRCAVRA
jgi:hypothetical protein